VDEARKVPFVQALLWVLLGGLGAQLAGGFAAGVVQALLKARGAPAEGLSTSVVVVVPSVLVSGSSLIGIALLVPRLAGVPAQQALGLRPAPAISYAAAALGTVMLGPTADVLMRFMDTHFPGTTLEVVPMINQVVRAMPAALALPVFAILPGVSEELMFRGLLQNAVRRAGPAIAVSGVGFALFHVDPHHAAGVLPLGLFLAWVGHRCGTYVAIFAHTLNNAAAIFAVHSGTFDVGYGSETEMPWYWVPVSLAFVLFAVVVIARATRSGPPHSGPMGAL
jgi:membrane protease YdiL (CAAX protease family)